MDPVTATVVAGVLWFFGIWVGAYVIIFAVTGLFALISASVDQPWILALGVALGWLGGISWAIFAVVQVILHIVDLIALL